MSIVIHPIHPVIGAEVTGINIRTPLSRAEVAAIDAGLDRYAVLVFHDQPMTDEEQLAFSENFGTLQEGSNSLMKPGDLRLAPAFADVSNLDKNNSKLARDDRRRMFALANRLWHSDASFRAIPAKYSILSGRIVPPTGGNTEFASMCAAYDALDDVAKAEVEDLICEHSLMHSRALLGFTEYTDEERRKYAPVRQRLVRTLPSNGRKSLFLAAHIGDIVGWPKPEALAFIRDLMEHATQRQFVYSHQWRAGDLVMWDNRQTMHRVRRFDDLSQVRDMRRTTINGTEPTVAQAA